MTVKIEFICVRNCIFVIDFQKRTCWTCSVYLPKYPKIQNVVYTAHAGCRACKLKMAFLCFLLTPEEKNYSILVRDCAVDSGGVNSESEIGRESHCWMVRRIKYMDQYMTGCSLACHTDGCNHSNSIHASYWLLIPFLGYFLATGIVNNVLWMNDRLALDQTNITSKDWLFYFS